SRTVQRSLPAIAVHIGPVLNAHASADHRRLTGIVLPNHWQGRSAGVGGCESHWLALVVAALAHHYDDRLAAPLRVLQDRPHSLLRLGHCGEWPVTVAGIRACLCS